MSDNPFEREFTDASFWDKSKNVAKLAGKTVLEPALKLYYSAKDPDTPMWAKSAIYGALGYFISPIDAIPDFTPILGYSDDIGVLMAAAVAVATYIKKEHAEKAKETIEQWFG
jgi:uncharacterized membrane protein YkvA (DUF1232 family)